MPGYELDSVARILREWHRLVAMVSGDDALTLQGDATDDIAYHYLTVGSRNAQVWMLDQGYQSWRKRSSALSFTGTDADDGGRKATLPSDFLRAFSPRSHKLPGQKRTALVEPNGDLWGTEVWADDRTASGNFYYFRGEELWLARAAEPPATLYLEFHYLHPAWDADTTIDFPLRARRLIPAEGAEAAKEESWFPAGDDYRAAISRALDAARREAAAYARMSKRPREMRRMARHGTHY